jgi:23S rRNA (guanosine2251-2'-O)-methyltransferase
LLITNNILKEIPELEQFQSKTQITNSQHITSTLGHDAVHQNIAAEFSQLDHQPLEEIIALNKTKSCFIILDQITDPHNVGAIMRTAAAFDVDGVITTYDNSAQESSIMAKVACGALDIVNFIQVTNLVSTINLLKKAGYWITGLDHRGPILDKNIFHPKSVFILGAEDKGLRRLTKENCDYLIRIPMSDQMESLNVSNAAAIVLYTHFTK